MKPLIAIVGRPNVGKSMLFNKLVGQRLSIVEDTPGVTRDRLYAEAEWRNRKFDLVDTGGIEPSADSQILAFMRQQAEIAIQHATVILFVCDIKTGLTASDQEVANMLLRSQKPVVLAVNKMDQVGITNPDIYEFYNLGLGDPIAVSAVHGHGTGDLLDACMEYFPPEDEEEEEDDVIKVAVPLITPVIFFNFIMQTSGTFQEFTGPYVITGGGPTYYTYLFSLYIYDTAFKYFDMGYGAALAWVLFLVVAAFAAVAFKSSKYWVFYSADKGGKNG